MKIPLHHPMYAAVVAMVFAGQPVHACLNDRDTLAEEAQKHPDILQAITGRFERNPPLYYQMRITRVENDLQTHPDNLDEYDDIAVACDRLGRDDEAISWEERKMGRLPQYDPGNAAMKEQWYKCYANIGTARVHRWLRAGAKPARIVEVKQARQEIAGAVRIKPNAHFGRETYQLAVMDWIIDSSSTQTSYGTSDTLADYLIQNPPESDKSLRGAGTALAGLITLGNAWESVDIFTALAAAAPHASVLRSEYHLSSLATLRAEELRKAGHKSLFEVGKEHTVSSDLAQSDDGRTFAQLRAEADRWQRARTDYMMARLTAGRHPDTDPTFWADYRPAPAPQLEDEWGRKLHMFLRRRFSGNAMLIEMLIYLFGISLGGYGAVRLTQFLMRRLIGRWRTRKSASPASTS
ncbi:hypothetical protein CCAX7_11170 [Capsulimonas corticalis]|uniref:Uncharacterized protein n=1 Tax=Capsulimonas corticalis TaxID=2219043 RepID=A0A402CUR2_9BACT|nr:hypothetical protein [Capsulimonas corticalis]BDI29066.1 hypothetical protein CCAX7_11170 [Capsulimonas corticalis]